MEIKMTFVFGLCDFCGTFCSLELLIQLEKESSESHALETQGEW
jgi:hypothetical protein